MHERLCPATKGDGFGFLCRPNNGSHQSFKRNRTATHASSVLQLDVAVGAVEDLPHHFFWNASDGRAKGDVVGSQNGFDDSRGQVVLEFAKRGDATFLHADARVWHQGFRIHLGHFSQSVARWACTVWAVETEEVGFWFRVGQAGGGAHQVPREVHGNVGVQWHDRHGSLAQRQRGLYGLQHALCILRPDHDAVDHGFDVVDFVTVHFEARLQFHQLAVNACPEVAKAHDLFEEFSVVPFPSADHGGEEQEFLAFEAFQNVRGDLIVGVAHHGFARFKGKRVGSPGVQQPQKVVQFRDRADGGTRVFGHGFLFNGHHRAQP